jgi:hypothetical protein
VVISFYERNLMKKEKTGDVGVFGIISGQYGEPSGSQPGWHVEI